MVFVFTQRISRQRAVLRYIKSNALKNALCIIDTVIYATLATVSKDHWPWNSPVYCAVDTRLRFFWLSTPESQHSCNIHHNQRVFMVIYDSTVPEGMGRGVYIQAEAKELTEQKDIEWGQHCMLQRLGKPIAPDATLQPIKKSRRMYRAIPEKIWMNDVILDTNGRIERDIRIELDLPELIRLRIASSESHRDDRSLSQVLSY